MDFYHNLEFPKLEELYCQLTKKIKNLLKLQEVIRHHQLKAAFKNFIIDMKKCLKKIKIKITY